MSELEELGLSVWVQVRVQAKVRASHAPEPSVTM